MTPPFAVPGGHRGARRPDDLLRHRRGRRGPQERRDLPAQLLDRGGPRQRLHLGSSREAGNCRISPVDISGSVYNWTYTTPFNLTPGTYSFTVRATDDEDKTTSSNNQGRLTINAAVPG